MELRVLKYFLMVAREESITKAAERLHITQPTLSRQMADLEKEMGVPLLDRSGRRMGLTPEGMLLRRRAEEIISLVDKTEMEVTQAQENLEGTINIAGGDLAATRDFVKLIKEFHELHPHVDFQYYTDITPYICECIDHGCVDIGLLVQPFDVEKYNFLALGEEKAFGVYMRSDEPLAEKDEVNIEDLKGKPLIQTIREDWYAQFSGSSEYLEGTKALIRVTLPNNAAIMVDEGIGYFLASDGIIPFLDERRICFRPLSPGRQYAKTALAWRRNQPFSRAAQAFLDFLKERLEK